jgi:hypothetical protein
VACSCGMIMILRFRKGQGIPNSAGKVQASEERLCSKKLMIMDVQECRLLRQFACVC